ncbi:MAG: YezD family protein [Solibacillus sp.]
MSKKENNTDVVLENIKASLETLKYGTITLVVQDGVVIQIEKNEKIRLK